MAKRHDDALFIQAGACNPIAISRSLSWACGAAHDDDAKKPPGKRQGFMAIRQDPAVRLITHQLCHLFGMIVDDTPQSYPEAFGWKKAYDECLLQASPATLASLQLQGEYQRLQAAREGAVTD
jgi:hypothetical protein